MGIQVVRGLEVLVLSCGAALCHSDLALSLFPSSREDAEHSGVLDQFPEVALLVCNQVH